MRELKSHCPNGHEYSDANTYAVGKRRWCRTCKYRKLAAKRKARRRIAREFRANKADEF